MRGSASFSTQNYRRPSSPSFRVQPFRGSNRSQSGRSLRRISFVPTTNPADSDDNTVLFSCYYFWFYLLRNCPDKPKMQFHIGVAEYDGHVDTHSLKVSNNKRVFGSMNISQPTENCNSNSIKDHDTELSIGSMLFDIYTIF